MSALTLRIIATLTMLLDHIGYCFGIFPLRVIGRMAFPLYVFLMVNGFRYTKNRKKYALRFAIFAVISQIPFQLMRYGGVISLKTIINLPILLVDEMNVMVTLLLGLIVIWLGEILRKGNRTRYICLLPAIAVFFTYHYGLIDSDYGAKGILLATVFWFFDGKKLLTAFGLFVSMYYGDILRYVHCIIHGKDLPLPSAWEMANLAILLILPLIFLYNQKSGMPRNPKAKKVLQLGFYAFYPLHMLILYLLIRFAA